jgi:hypothetical protein
VVVGLALATALVAQTVVTVRRGGRG